MTRSVELTEALASGPFVAALEGERGFQERQWGDNHDDNHDAGEWAMILGDRLGSLDRALLASFGYEQWFEDDDDYCLNAIYAASVKLAAVCYALTDSIGRRRKWRREMDAPE